MMLQAAGRNVPIVWMGDKVDLSGSDSDGENGRRGYAVRALVHHRIVGSLESAIATFTDQNASGRTRRVCSTFGIGFLGSTLTIVQFVAIQDTAYCNGQTDADVKALLSTRPWSVYSAVRKAAGGHVSANYFTVSTEHEDNGAAGDYIVRDEVAEASMALDRVLLTGDPGIIRGAGIRCSDAAAAQLGRIVPTKETIVDHNRCSPVSKPYCWRPYDGDKVGFPQARFLAALTGSPEDDMPGLDFALDVTQDADPAGSIGTAALLPGTKIRVIRTRDMGLVDLPEAADLGVVQRGTLTTDQTIGGSVRKAGTPIAVFNHGGRTHAALWPDIGDSFHPLSFGGSTVAARQAEWDRIREELKVELPPRPA